MIGIVTYFQTNNYGVIFQAFALNYKIQQLGYKAEIVNYRSSHISKRNFTKFCRNVVTSETFVSKFQYIFCYLLTKKIFNEFKYDYLNISKKRYRKSNLGNLNLDYSKFISGSDQIWNPNINDGDMTYALDFANSKKKYSYAASFGYSYIPSKYYELFKKNLSKYKLISVRELIGSQIISDIIRVNVEISLDPVLLLSKEDWCQLFELNEQDLGFYFLFYNGTLNMQVEHHILEKYKNKKIVHLNNSSREVESVNTIRIAKPNEWLNYIRNSETVITNTYHGVLFALVFGRNFEYIYSSDSIEFRSRFDSIINLFGLCGRVEKISDSESVFISELDYDAVSSKIIKLREDSIAYLLKILID